jgi:hypothetical protein
MTRPFAITKSSDDGRLQALSSKVASKTDREDRGIGAVGFWGFGVLANCRVFSGQLRHSGVQFIYALTAGRRPAQSLSSQSPEARKPQNPRRFAPHCRPAVQQPISRWIHNHPSHEEKCMPRRSRLGSRAAIGYLAVALLPHGLAAQTHRTPDSLTNREFWEFFTRASEESGVFPSENFVSNEKTYQYVIPSLQDLTPNGVYLGVGPEQNFTYIVNVKPRLAVIIDIRRQNAMQHFMYKALFELSASRAEFAARLFSRPLRTPPSPASSASQLFDAVAAAAPSDSAFEFNWREIVAQLTVVHNFPISALDLATIRHVYSAFFEAGPEISYSYRLGTPPSPTPWLVTFAQLQSATTADSVNMSFMATEANYQWLRTMQQRNLVVPVVGDFAGPKAIRTVATYLTARGAVVTAFYVSNVEQYLFGGFGAEQRFYRNVAALPIDSTSMFIRSLPSSGPAVPTIILQSPMLAYSFRILDIRGRRVFRVPLFDTTLVFSTRPPAGASSLSLSSGGAFTSGIASIRHTLDAFETGELKSYSQLIALTKTEGWSQSAR